MKAEREEAEKEQWKLKAGSEEAEKEQWKKKYHENSDKLYALERRQEEDLMKSGGKSAISVVMTAFMAHRFKAGSEEAEKEQWKKKYHENSDKLYALERRQEEDLMKSGGKSAISVIMTAFMAHRFKDITRGQLLSALNSLKKIQVSLEVPTRPSWSYLLR